MATEKKNQEKKDIPKWHNAEKVLITKIMLERNPQDKNLLKSVVLVTPEFNINYYAKKTTVTTDKVLNYETSLTQEHSYTVSEFIANAKLLNIIAENLQKGSQEIVCSFSESVFNDKTYYRMYKGQYETIYYEPFHKDDKSNIQKQQEKKAKAELNEEYPM